MKLQNIQEFINESKDPDTSGYTRSGKTIYKDANHPSHKAFTKEDHNDAGGHHSYKGDWGRKVEREHHKKQSEIHYEAAKHKPADTVNKHFDINGHDRDYNEFTISARGKDKKEALKNARKAGSSGDRYPAEDNE